VGERISYQANGRATQGYLAANHAFFNETRPVYDAAAASAAWTTTIAFFRKELIA
jgi:dienelactone hydrolase